MNIYARFKDLYNTAITESWGEGEEAMAGMLYELIVKECATKLESKGLTEAAAEIKDYFGVYDNLI